MPTDFENFFWRSYLARDALFLISKMFVLFVSINESGSCFPGSRSPETEEYHKKKLTSIQKKRGIPLYLPGSA